MDIELIMDVLEKHGITNIALAEDIQTLAKESYIDGRHDEAFWWQQQDSDDAWIGQFDLAKGIMEEDKDVLKSLATGEEIVGDFPYQPELFSKSDAEELQAKQIENSDMKDAINKFIDDHKKEGDTDGEE